MASTSKVTMLSKPSEWELWFFAIKVIARTENVWQFIDPDLPTEPLVPSVPIKPIPADVNPAKSTIVTLDEGERELFKLLLTDYKEEKIINKEIHTALNGIQKHIVTSVSTENHVYIRDEETTYQMLRKLKSRLAPTDYARKLEVIRRYNKLKTFSKRENIDKWLKDWEVTYTDGKGLRIPEVDEECPLLNFTHAISAIDSGYASTQEYFLMKLIKKSEPLPNFHDLVEDFRDHHRSSEGLKLSASHSGFITLRGETREPEEKTGDSGKGDAGKNEGKKPDGRKTQGNSREDGRVCLYGDKHGKGTRWEDCIYINPECRTKGWRGNSKAFTRINKTLEGWGQSKADWFVGKFNYDGLKNSQPSASKPDAPSHRVDPNESSSFVTYYSFPSKQPYKLYNCWTLDNATDIHVCNDITRSGFLKTRDAGLDDTLCAGKSVFPIEAFGNVVIQVGTKGGLKDIQLTNVALAPGFMTSIGLL
jgi:hypothetical protein